MEETLKDVAADTSAEVEETTNSNESGNEDATELASKLEEQRKANSQILARAKKAEEELKKFKSAPSINSNQSISSEELKLIARGLSDEEISQAKVIAKGKDISLPDAIKDPLFVSYQETLKKQKESEDAKLGASHGSGESPDESLVKPNMSREEHMKVFNQVMGK